MNTPKTISDSLLMRESDTTAHRFQCLTQQLKTDTLYLSSLSDIYLHPAYQQIIGMGQPALPLILQALDDEPDPWFWALFAITGQDPAAPDAQGNFDAVRKSWLDWGRTHGYLA